MNDFLAGLTRWLIRAVVVVAGLVIFLSLLAAVLVLVATGTFVMSKFWAFKASSTA